MTKTLRPTRLLTNAKIKDNSAKNKYFKSADGIN